MPTPEMPQGTPNHDVFTGAQQVATSKPIEAMPTTPSQADQWDLKNHSLKYAEWYAVAIFAVLGLIWFVFLPKRHSVAYDPNPEVELHERLKQALEAAKGQSITRTASRIPREVPAVFVATDSSANPAGQTDWNKVVEELRTDLTVWNRYEEELRTFAWGADFNWYVQSSLRILVIALSAVTPALIVAPVFSTKKFLAALPAAIVAIGTGCIVEFDFKTHAAINDTALVQVQGEKTAFITRSSPFYLDAPPKDTQANGSSGSGSTSSQGTKGANAGAQSNTNKGDSKPKSAQAQFESFCTLGEGEVPFPTPTSYPEARANFACRIQQIMEVQNGERVQFLRGQTPPNNPRQTTSDTSTKK